MELVAIEPHVDVVEGAHGRPAVLVGEADGNDAVRLHLRGEGLEGVKGLRHLVPLLRPEALPVEEPPGVVVVGYEVHLAVRPGGGLLQRIGVVAADGFPDVVDGREEALACVELHAVAGEPGKRIVRRALQVGVDLVLEIVVGHHIGGYLLAGLGREGVGDGLVRALGDVIRGPGTEGEAGGTGTRRGRRAAAGAGGQERDAGQACRAHADGLEDAPPARKSGCRSIKL
jgi:hypothetical protein